MKTAEKKNLPTDRMLAIRPSVKKKSKTSGERKFQGKEPSQRLIRKKGRGGDWVFLSSTRINRLSPYPLAKQNLGL